MVELNIHSQRRVSGGSSGGFGRISSGGTAASAVSGLAGIASNLITAGIKKSGEDRFERWVGRTEEALAQARANGAGNAEREGMLRTLISESNLTGKHRMAARKAITIQSLKRTRQADGSVIQEDRHGNVISNTLGANAEEGEYSGELDSANRQVAQAVKVAPRASKAYESFITNHLDEPTRKGISEQELDLIYNTNDLMSYISGKNRGIIFKDQPMINTSEIGQRQNQNFAQMKNLYEMVVNNLDEITGSLIGEEKIMPKNAGGQVLKALEADMRQMFMKDGTRQAFGLGEDMTKLDDMFDTSQDRTAQWSEFASKGGLVDSMVEFATLKNTYQRVVNELEKSKVWAGMSDRNKRLEVMYPVIKSLESISTWVLKKGDIVGRDAFITDAITQITADTVGVYLTNLESPDTRPIGDELERQMQVIIRSGSTYGSAALVKRVQDTVGNIIKNYEWKSPARKSRLITAYKAWLERATSMAPKVEALRNP
jgi:hypothetical protein